VSDRDRDRDRERERERERERDNNSIAFNNVNNGKDLVKEQREDLKVVQVSINKK